MDNKIKKLIKDRAKVISLQYGLGEVVGIFAMYDGIDDYLEVEYLVDSKLRYFCIKHINDVRVVSSRSTINDALNLMSKKLNDSSIINKFNESTITFLEKDVLFIIERIVELFRRNELSVKDNILLHLTIDSLVHEVEAVFKVNHQCARGIVSDYLKCA